MTRPEPIQHDEAVELLPWLVNGSLDSGEHDAVETHARNCVICRRELEELQVVQQSVSTLGELGEIPAPDMRRINARIDAELERRSLVGYLQDCWQQFTESRLRVAFAVQTVALLAIAGLFLMPPEPEPEFTTLSSPEALPAGHFLRVVFDPTLPADDVAKIVQANRLTVFSGPSNRGVITLQFSDAAIASDREKVLRGLQDDSRILFAQYAEGSH